MAGLPKQNLNINFSQGLDTKTDPFQVPSGKFLALSNSIFDKAGRLTKRNGYGSLTELPDTSSQYLTTFNGNLTALGTSLQAFSDGSNSWIDKGTIRPIDLNVVPVVRSNTNQSQSDSVVAPNNIVCTAFMDNVPVAGVNVGVPKFIITDAITGQSIVNATALPLADPIYGAPKVFLLASNFIILYVEESSPGVRNLVYTAISSIAPETGLTTPIQIAPTVIVALTQAFDGVVLNNRLFIAYSTAVGGQKVRVTYISSTLGYAVTPVDFSSEFMTMASLTTDSISNPTAPFVYLTYYYFGAVLTKMVVIDPVLLAVITPPTTISGAGALRNLTSTAYNRVLSIFVENFVYQPYTPVAPLHTVGMLKYTSAGVQTQAYTAVAKSVGLSSKAFIRDGESYFMGVYPSSFQPSYFLLNERGQVISQLAYTNAGPAHLYGLPSVTLRDDIAFVPYLYKDLVQAANRSQGVAAPAGVYAQTGVNLASINFSPNHVATSEIGNNLNLTGGFVSAYDGSAIVEQGFFVYPENIGYSIAATGGAMIQQQYYYQVTYEWADSQGNLFRSAPSLPVGINVTTGSGAAAVTIKVPTLHLTYKTANPVKIVIYRWSVAQQTYYQVTSILTPVLNDRSLNFVSFVDTLSDSSIIGNNILYTTGGVIENIAPPPSSIMTLFNNRLWLVQAENRNLLWFSKQVIQATPVEMSDLLTTFVAPTTASQGSTGYITALAPLDDKLIVWKQNALGYISGIGPDNTGANSQYSDFQLINSVVGCTNPRSIVSTPNGLMFQSEKGIWLLSRNLNTTYIGAPVEALTTGATVLSAVNIPKTNQIRMTLDTGITLMYDYFFDQWGTFSNVPAISSTLYENYHTYLSSGGQIYQETPGAYLDGSAPVLMSFTTSWINLAGVQGFERFYEMYLLGQYLSPFKLNVKLAYDYNQSATQATTITSGKIPTYWGDGSSWGSGGAWGTPESPSWESSVNIFEARLFPQRQKCESFQITISETSDAAYPGVSGAGLTLSGLNLVVGTKRGSRTSRASRNFG